MDINILKRLEMLNQLSLTEKQEEEFLAFYNKKEEELKELDVIDTENVERMVHVMPVMTVVREDVVNQPFSRESLQEGAPEVDEGYWCVPRVVE